MLHELSARDVVALFSRADRLVYETPPVVEELRAWLRLDPRDPRYTEDGLNFECLDLSRLEARALALALRPRVLPFARRAFDRPPPRASSAAITRSSCSKDHQKPCGRAAGHCCACGSPSTAMATAPIR